MRLLNLYLPLAGIVVVNRELPNLQSLVLNPDPIKTMPKYASGPLDEARNCTDTRYNGISVINLSQTSDFFIC